MSFQVGSKDLFVTHQFSTLYLVGGNDINGNSTASIQKQGDLRVAGGALVSKSLRVGDNLYVDGNIFASSVFVDDFLSGNVLLIDTIGERRIDRGITVYGNIHIDPANCLFGNLCGNVYAMGNFHILNNLDVLGNATFHDSVLINRNLVTEGSAVFGNQVTIEGNLVLGHPITVNTINTANVTTGVLNTSVLNGANLGNLSGAVSGDVIAFNGTSFVSTTETYTTASTGTNFVITNVGSHHTFALPDASTTARGLVNTTSQTFGGVKTFNSAPVIAAITNGGATLTLPTTTDTLTGRNTADVLTNKVLTDVSDTITATGLWASGTTVQVNTSVAPTVGQTLVASTSSIATWQTLVPTGSGFDYWGTSLPTGYVWASGKTIGDASSNATERANADTVALFEVLWNATTNTTLQLYTSNTVLQARGLSALADFNAHYQLTIPDKRGRASAGLDNLGGTAAGRLTLTPDGQTLGATGGAQTHTLTMSEMPTHDHTGTTDTESTGHTHNIPLGNTNDGYSGSYPAVNSAGCNTAQDAVTVSLGESNSHTHTFTSNSTGGGSAHNIIQPTIVCSYIIKL